MDGAVYYTNLSPRNVKDAACAAFVASLRNNTRENFCRNLLLSDPRNSEGWPPEQLEGPVSIHVVHQQVFRQDPNDGGHRIWILLGEFHDRLHLCDPANIVSVEQFLENITRNIGNCAADFMIEATPGSISGGVILDPAMVSPMSDMSVFFQPCSDHSFEQLHTMKQTGASPACYDLMIKNNLRVTYVDPRMQVAKDHPAKRLREPDSVGAAELLRSLLDRHRPQTSSERFNALSNLVMKDTVPRDNLTRRRAHRFLCDMTRFVRLRNLDPHHFSLLARRLLLLLEDVIPVAFYMTPTIQSQIEYIDEPYASRILHAFRSSAWEGKLFHDRFETCHKELRTLLYENLYTPVQQQFPPDTGAIDIFLRTMEITRASSTRCETHCNINLTSGILDMYTICRSLRRWNTEDIANRDFKYGAAPRVPCVIVVYAGAAHTEHIHSILPRLSPTDTLYAYTTSRKRQCVSLDKQYVLKLNDYGEGTLAFYRDSE